MQAGASWQKWETVAASGFLGQSAPEVLAGLGDAHARRTSSGCCGRAASCRTKWSSRPAKPQVIEQIDRRGSSCPIVFTWNGTRYEFITDGIGPGVVGHWVAPGERNVPDPDEYIKIAGAQLQPKDGRLSVKFAEPMEEVIYLDQVRLFAIDHPRGRGHLPARVLRRDRAAAARRRSIVARGARLPRGRVGRARAATCSPLLRARATGATSRASGDAPFKGFAALHALELDLGELPAERPRAPASCAASPTTSPRRRCSPRTRRTSRRSCRTSRRSCRTARGRASATTSASPPACGAR